MLRRDHHRTRDRIRAWPAADLDGVDLRLGERVREPYPRHWHEELSLCLHTAGGGVLELGGTTHAAPPACVFIVPWHYDHTMGNGTYVAAYPGIAVVAQRATAEAIAGYNPGWFERYPKRRALFEEGVATGKDRDGKTLDADTIATYEKAAQGVSKVEPEFKAIVDHPPDTTFERELRVDLGGREVVLLHLGRGGVPRPVQAMSDHSPRHRPKRPVAG